MPAKKLPDSIEVDTEICSTTGSQPVVKATVGIRVKDGSGSWVRKVSAHATAARLDEAEDEATKRALVKAGLEASGGDGA